jgi:hypothetical protein
MSKKIIVGLLAIFGLLGLGFAWGGFMNSPAAAALPDDAKAEFKAAFEAKDFETLKELRAEYMPEGPRPLAELDEETKEEILSLREQIHDAMISGDYETADGLREQMRGLMPEGFHPNAPMMAGGPRGMRGFGHGEMGGLGECPCASAE